MPKNSCGLKRFVKFREAYNSMTIAQWQANPRLYVGRCAACDFLHIREHAAHLWERMSPEDRDTGRPAEARTY